MVLYKYPNVWGFFMYIKNLEINAFRNINHLSISFHNKKNIFYGKNAQGKTNLLESILLCLNGYSHREQKTSNFINKNEQEASISIEVIREDDLNDDVTLVLNSKRKYLLNKEPLRSKSELLRNFNLVMFTPEDLRIIKGSPINRRKFLNESISALYPRYSLALKEYNKTLNQRNALLKESGYIDSLLDVYDDTLASIGANIVKIRIKVLKQIEQITNKLNSQIQKDEQLKIFYSSNVLKSKDDLNNLEKIFINSLKESRKEDKLKGYTTIGVQHDDFNIFLNDLNAKSFASQGQQRSICLCMKLSIIELLYNKYHEKPIVLLDDVMSDLDEFRQSQVLNLIDDLQVFITCVNYDFLKIRDDYKIFNVNQGSIVDKEEKSGK